MGTWLGIRYGSSKVHQRCDETCPPFAKILSALLTPNYNLVKFLVHILGPLTTDKYTGKSWFNLKLLMGILDKDSLFTNIPLEERIEIYSNDFV